MSQQSAADALNSIVYDLKSVDVEEHDVASSESDTSFTSSSAEQSRAHGLHPVLEQLSSACEKHQASDIFISTGFPPSLKIHGELTPMKYPALSAQDAKTLVYSTLSDAQRARFAKELELNYSVSSKTGVRYRVNAYHEQGRIGMIWRRDRKSVV